MALTALLFPGQGSQRVGMGKELAREFEVARRVFEEADATLGFSISKLCWEGPEDDLVLTAHTQPAILTNSIAVLRTLEKEKGLVFGACAGHSLGEFSALVAAGALSFADAVRLVHLRGRAMQEAVAQGVGAMAALMGLSPEDVSLICKEVAHGEIVAPANLNGAGQVVIAGHAGAVDRAISLARQRGAKRAVPLNVSAPFHCALMASAAERLARELAPVHVGPLCVPVITNVEATPNHDAGRVKDLLIRQVTAPVKWEDSVKSLAKMGCEIGLELGSGAVLSGLVKRISPSIRVTTIGEPHEVAAWPKA
ncbi:MAG: ACP S-malonyltransferase [Deltaproteobacteria bacterium]|nr:ACP S-malonyltransferase [Deltaproteobacteria bacterium]